ncbi:hypothetical protein J3E68DRAFT_398020 [Trichoderma sp. SZMC 28012]
MGHRHASTPTCLPHPMPLLHPLYEHQRDSLARWIVLSAQPPPVLEPPRCALYHVMELLCCIQTDGQP